MKPITKPTTLLINPSWLAVPIETLNDAAMSTRRVPKKAETVYARAMLKSKAGTSRSLLELFLTLDVSLSMKYQRLKLYIEFVRFMKQTAEKKRIGKNKSSTCGAPRLFEISLEVSFAF
jgi:hypothetical protein